MLEKQRLTYLEHLGIENYVPKRVLVGAAPSQLLSDEALLDPIAFSTRDHVHLSGEKEYVEQAVAIHTDDRDAVVDSANDTDSNQSDQHTDVSATVLADFLESKPEQSRPKKPQHVTTPDAIPAAGNTSTADHQAIRFTLNVWRISHSFLVVDSRQPAMALPTDKLLQNILRAIGYSMAQLPPSELLRWPLFKSADTSIAQEEIEARAMVQAYISAQFNKVSDDSASAKILLLLGENAVRFALDPNGDIDSFFNQHQGSSIDQPQWQASALIAPSLIDMLQAPLKKRITWQALQTLFE